MLEQIKEQIKVVVLHRSIAKSNSDILQMDREAWEKENKEQIDLAAATKQDVIEAEAKLRELTLEVYAQTGDKAPVPGVGIREVTKLEYDNKVAFDWAKAHKMALQLDVKAFEKIAKVDPPTFVKITTEPLATIATQLEVVD